MVWTPYGSPNNAVSFVQDYPAFIDVKVDSFSISNSYKSEVLITASLRADQGVPSEGYSVSFEVLSLDGSEIGNFLNDNNIAHTNTQGKALIRFTAGETGITGRLSIIESTEDENHKEFKDTAYIYLTH